MRISNHAALAVTTARAAALDIAEAGLEAIDTAAAVRRAVRLTGGALLVGDEAWPLRPPGRLLLVAAGKCATAAAAELVRLLGDRLDGGIVLDVDAAVARDLGPLLVGDGETVVTVASDGRDNGDFAGGVADPLGRAAAQRLGLDLDAYLADNDSYGFFERTGDCLVTGATGTNVADLIIGLRA